MDHSVRTATLYMTLDIHHVKGRQVMPSYIQVYLTREMAYRPTEARAYGDDNIAVPFYKLLAYARVCLDLWTHLAVSAYAGD